MAIVREIVLGLRQLEQDCRLFVLCEGGFNHGNDSITLRGYAFKERTTCMSTETNCQIRKSGFVELVSIDVVTSAITALALVSITVTIDINTAFPPS